jgi:hypothetical protein
MSFDSYRVRGWTCVRFATRNHSRTTPRSESACPDGKDRIAAGERADVFASANTEHPRALAAAGKAGAVSRFVRNALCPLARHGFSPP